MYTHNVLFDVKQMSLVRVLVVGEIYFGHTHATSWMAGELPNEKRQRVELACLVSLTRSFLSTTTIPVAVVIHVVVGLVDAVFLIFPRSRRQVLLSSDNVRAE